MNNKVRVVFNRRKQASKTNCAVVEVVVCFGRERFYFSTGIFINLMQWKDGEIINHPRAAILNEEIKKKITEFEHIIIAMEVMGDEMDVEHFKSYISPEERGNHRNFMAWMNERIQKRKMRESTRKQHMVGFKAAQRFGRFKTFDDLTLPNIYAFDLFLREEKTFTSTGKPIVRSQASIHNYHKHLKSYVSEAFHLGLIKENPYDRFQDKRGDNGERKHLTKEQIQKLIELRESSTNTIANKYLDFFLFQIFTGMAYSDAKLFDYEQQVITIDGREFIDGKRLKTGKEFITPILPYTKKILERNDYKLHIPSNQKYNQFLKGIGLAINCGFPLTTHVARHTFACTISLGEGVPKEVLQVMMGHSSIKTTEIYAKLPIEFVCQNLNKTLFSVWK